MPGIIVQIPRAVKLGKPETAPGCSHIRLILIAVLLVRKVNWRALVGLF
jgi:hypothetical protein